jgi:hypothetical protein
MSMDYSLSAAAAVVMNASNQPTQLAMPAYTTTTTTTTTTYYIVIMYEHVLLRQLSRDRLSYH